MSSSRRAIAWAAGILLTGFVAAFLGLLPVFLPWWFVLAVVALLVIVIAVFAFPEQSIVVLLMMGSGLVPRQLLVSIPLGPGRILASDIVIAALMCFAFVKMMRAPDRVLKALPWMRPVVVLLILTGVGIVVGKFLFNSSVKDVFQEARVQVYWFVLPLVIAFVPDEKRAKRLMWGLVILGLCLAIAVVAQFITGRIFIENARVENLMTLTSTYHDVTRSTAGGAIYLILLPLFFLLAIGLGGTLRTAYVLPLIAILAAGVVVSFGRAIWLASIVATLLLAFYLKGAKGVIGVGFAAVLGLVISIGGLVAVKPKTIDAAYERLASTFEEGSRKSSLGWRFEEAHFAAKALSGSPILGIGYGTAYKPYIPLSGAIEQDVSLMRYSHNAFIGLWLKLGLPGLLAVLWLIVAATHRGLQVLKGTQDEYLRAICSAALAGFFVANVASLTQPDWLVSTGIMFFGLVLGLMATCDLLGRRKAA